MNQDTVDTASDAAALDLSAEGLLARARAVSGLSDFGDPWFMQPLRRFSEALRTEAHLSDFGMRLQRRRMVHGLVNRLRLIDAVKLHPEILDEQVTVAGVIVGLPRTGSTLFQRMLSNAPGINSIRWWENHSYSPFPGEKPGEPTARRQHAYTVLEDFVRAGMMSIHPFDIDAPDEEIIIIEQLFVGTGPEAGAYVPSFAEWVSTFDHRPIYEDLRTILKFLQWQVPSRRGKKWILKSPGHLPTLDALLAVFPEALIITNHRDPLQTIPSWCSMLGALQKMVTENFDGVVMGRFTERRWAGFLERYEKVREEVGPAHFIDIEYAELMRDPVQAARSVLSRLGIEMTAAAAAEMTAWLEENARDKRAPHEYSLEEYGLTHQMLEADFAAYRQRFVRASAGE